MLGWQPLAYKNYRWIVADPDLLGGKLAIRGTRLSVSLILECLANGMTLEEIDEAFDYLFPREAMPEVLRVASKLTEAFQGWKALSKGHLVDAAAQAAFNVYLPGTPLWRVSVAWPATASYVRAGAHEASTAALAGVPQTFL